MRIGLADKTLVVAIAHAIVLKDIGQSPYLTDIGGRAYLVGDKKMSPEKLAAMLEQGAEKVKQIYR